MPGLLVLAGIIVYFNSFQGVFLLDDATHIENNERIRSFWPPGDLLSGRRPLVDLTLAVNFAVHGLDRWGYHAVNLFFHILVALTLYGVVRRTASRGAYRERCERAAPWLALAVALIWLVHPLHTQSVTYVIQRGESMMGLFYLLTIYCVIRAADATRGGSWYVAAVAACAAGMASKAVMVTAPLTVLLYDRLFIAGSFKMAIVRRWGLYLGLAATLSVLVLCGEAWGVLNPAPRPQANVGFGLRAVTPVEYLLSQPGVICHYLKLVVWPHSLCFDYDWPVARGWAEIIPPGTPVAALVIAGALALRRAPYFAFAVAWFFIVLVPTSSIIPIRDLAFEHRMYLPLAGVVLAFVVAGHALLVRVCGGGSRWAPARRMVASAAVLTVATALGFRTVRRNADYRSAMAMWTNVAEQRPENARAQCALGNAYMQKDNVELAVAHYRESVRLNPDYDFAHYNLGRALYAQGQVDEALAHYREAIRCNPTYALAYYNLAVVYADQGDAARAVEYYQHAARVKPRFAEAHTNLGAQLFNLGRDDDAIAALRRALEFSPGDALAHYNLALAMQRQGRLEEAAASLHESLRLAEGKGNTALEAAAQQNLGNVLLAMDRLDEALRAYRSVLRVDPKAHAAHYRIGVVLARQGKSNAAAAEYAAALRLKPDYEPAKEALKALREQQQGVDLP